MLCLEGVKNKIYAKVHCCESHEKTNTKYHSGEKSFKFRLRKKNCKLEICSHWKWDTKLKLKFYAFHF